MFFLFFKNKQKFVLQWVTYNASEWGQFIKYIYFNSIATNYKQHAC